MLEALEGLEALVREREGKECYLIALPILDYILEIRISDRGIDGMGWSGMDDLELWVGRE